MGILRATLVSSVALSFLAALASSADAAPRRYGNGVGYYPLAVRPAVVRPAAPAKKPQTEVVKKLIPEKEGFPDVPKGTVLQMVVSVGSQRVTLFSDGVPVKQSPVSTGTTSNPTPLGVFSVIEKDRYHRSNLYGNAPMFYMQRVTWSGVAMHEGMLPGYPASHGCIRLPTDFAARLWPTTRLGVRVIISRNDLAPVNFSHPVLFAPRPKPPEPRLAMNPSTEGLSSARPIRLAEATSDSGSMRDVTASPPPEALLNRAPGAPPDSAPAMQADRAPEASTAKPASDAAEDGKAMGRVTAPVETAKPAEDGKGTESTQAADAAPTDETVKATGTVTPPAPVEGAVPIAPSDLRKSVEVPQSSEPAQPAQATPAVVPPAGDAAVKPAATEDPPKPLTPRYKSADQPPKRSGQVAVFVSRKEKKIFVRQGFIPLLEMPIVIENLDQPLGTHVFTAMGFTDNGSGMRWNLITVPNDLARAPAPKDTRKKGKEPPKPVVVEMKPPSTAAEALNRIQMPKEAVDRINDLLIPGSSLVISDEGLGRETGRYTEFIVLTR